MLNVLISDDEPNICGLIEKLIDWSEMQLNLIAVSNDSSETLGIIRSKKPDIVITDIKMPGMSGLELIKQTIEDGLNIHFIIISGYNDFDYARTAIQYGVDAFLLKPINKQELRNVLSRISLKITDDRLKQQEEKDTRNKINKSLARIRRSFLTDIFYDHILSSDLSISRINDEYGFNFTENLFRFLLIKLDSASCSDDKLSSTACDISCELENKFRSICCEFEHCYTCGNIIILLNYFSHDSGIVKNMIGYFFDALEKFRGGTSNIHITMSVGSETGNFSEITSSMHTAKCGIKSRIINGTDKLVYFSSSDISENVIFPMREYRSEISDFIEIMDFDSAISVTKLFLDSNYDLIVKAAPSAPDILKSVAQIFLTAVNEYHNIESTYRKNFESICDVIDSMFVYRDMISYTLEKLTEITDNIQLGNGSSTKKMRIVKDYIDRHYGEKLDLEDVAAIVYLNPSYLGTLFKQETGMSFSNYLFQVRMDAAKNMLRDVKYNISEISEKVGYKEPRYFSKSFKKYTGVNPREYRNIYNK